MGHRTVARRPVAATRYSGLVDDEHAHGASNAREPTDPGKDRDQTAEDRDQRADAHDAASDARDTRADARDERAVAREEAADVVDAGAVADRVGALRDRRGGASDRTQAADDRQAAASDRLMSALERADYCIDELTGAHRRAAGLVELEREMARAKRTKQPFTLAFIDVDALSRPTTPTATPPAINSCAW